MYYSSNSNKKWILKTIVKLINFLNVINIKLISLKQLNFALIEFIIIIQLYK